VAPTSTTAGEPLSPAVQVEIRNAAGERVTTARDAVTLAFGANPGAGTLAGTKTVNAINGIASFTGIWVNKAATGYTLTATATGLTSATSSTFNIAAGAATRLRFVTQPVNAAGNVAQPASVTVAIVDAYDNTVTSATSTVTLGLASSPWRSLVSGGGGTLTATSLAVAAVSGVATFSNVRIDKPGPGYALSATTTGTVSAATSDAFNISVQFDGAISAGGAHSCAISTASGTYCWGVNSSGQLGGTTISSIDSIPVLVRGGLTFTSVVAGNAHSCGLTAAGTAYCWGNNGNGQLGINSTTNATQPALVSGGLVFQSLAAGGFHTCGLTTASGTAAIDRQVYCWGANWSGQIGVGTPASPYRFEVPTRVSEPLQTTRTVAITAGYEHTCAIATTSAAYCWGAGWAGQLGTNSVTATDAHVPTLVLGSHVWSSITAGNYHTCGISTTGGNIARCWGYNWAGQIGDNSSGTNRLVPTAVAGSVTTWSRLAAGGNFTCGTNASGTFCWGNNGSGEIGNDDPTTPVIIPTPVSGSLVFTSLTGGGSHACGRTATALYCWGSNSSGRLGSLGVGQVRRVPTLVIQ
jgi:alpha-tubulin suppressor-like RCC1 family protein